MIKTLSELNEEQTLFFKNFNSYRASGRRDEWSRAIRHTDFDRAGDGYDILVDELITLGLLKKNKAGAVSLSQLARVLINKPYGAEAAATRELNMRCKDSSYFNKR